MNQKLTKKLRTVMVLLGVAMLCLTACGNPQGNEGDLPTEPTPTTSAEANTPAPTNTVAPTNTLAPTSTPEPTATPTPIVVEDKEMDMTQFMDGFLPMPIVETLSEDCWGAAQVGARDQGNGLEDRDLSNYCYWDGGIIKDEETGKYYMFASRWNQAGGHWGENGISGWQGSQAVYAVSDNLYGPYMDMGPLWPDWCEGAGHNVFPFELSEADPLYGTYKYGIVISDTGMHGEIANGTIHVAKSLDGPWELLGKVVTEGGNFSLSNICILVRPDGTYEAINRNGDIAIAETIAGPWTVKETRLWWKVEGMSSDNVEDPVIWYSEGLYHCIANKWDARRAYYLTSEDGITNWVLHPGTAYTPDAQFMTYADGTENNWTKLERPNVYIEDGTIKAMTFAVIDVQKEEDFGNDAHGSKIIVVPFSGQSLSNFVQKENPFNAREGIIASEDTNIQSWGNEYQMNFGGETFIQVQRDPNWETYGMGVLGDGERPNDTYDNKIGFLKFDLAGTEYADSGKKIKSATLTLVYLYPMAGEATEDRLQVAMAENTWVEGTGNYSSNGNRVKRGALTWKLPAAVLDYGTAISEPFSTKIGSEEVKIDVTAILNAYRSANPEETLISFAFNETETGNRLRFASAEAGDIYAPRLVIEWE